MTNSSNDLPTLGEFVRFLQAKGCFVYTEVHEDPAGSPYIIMIMKSTVGSWVVLSQPDMSERLTRSVLDGYIRRLGLKRYIPVADEVLDVLDSSTPPE